MQKSTEMLGSALVVARAPLRISFVGGGTDVLSYATRFGGDAIVCAIDCHVWITLYPARFGGGCIAKFHSYEEVSQPLELHDEFARAVLTGRVEASGVQVASFSDVPAGTGLGGSAAFTVALLAALNRTVGNRTELARRASEIEITELGRSVGRNDHMVAAVGGLCRIRTQPTGSAQVEQIAVSSRVRDYIDDQLLLFYSGQQRSAANVLAAQDRATRDNAEEVVSALHHIKSLTERLSGVLVREDVGAIGPLLHENWECKRRLSSSVSTSRIDELYTAARTAGADGGKLLGAGSGGFLLVSCPPDRQAAVRSVMAARSAPELPFSLGDTGVEVMGVDGRGGRR